MFAMCLVVLLPACTPVGVGLAANNQGAALGLSTGLPLPTLSTPRDRRQALPPPTLVDPSAGTDTRQAAP